MLVLQVVRLHHRPRSIIFLEGTKTVSSSFRTSRLPLAAPSTSTSAARRQSTYTKGRKRFTAEDALKSVALHAHAQAELLLPQHRNEAGSHCLQQVAA